MVAHVDLDRAWAPEELAHALRAEFPRDLVLREVRPVDASFHARFDARERTYHYALALTDNPFFRFRRWSVPVLPSLGWIHGELDALRESRDFAALARVGGGSPDTRCRIMASEWRPMPGGAVLQVTADRFLYGMVRTLAGTLVRAFARGASRGHLAAVLQGGGRGAAGKAAPPQGLYLTGVRYADERSQANAGDRVAVLAGLGGGEVWA
jgi:tRNA pseudouridine38-40 synthase